MIDARVKVYNPVQGMSLDELRREHDQINADFNDHTVEIAKLRRSMDDTKLRLDALKSEIGRRTAPVVEPKVSEHAMLRYISRVHGIDLKELESHILTEGLKNAMKLGASTYKVDGYRYSIKNNVVTTIMD